MKKLTLTKSQAARYSGEEMGRFLRVLERWCEHLGRRGYRIDSAPAEGPGTMHWIARR